MYNFHLDRFTYFQTQLINTEKSLIPFIELFTGDIKSKRQVLEVGCAEGGVLKAFVDKGCLGTGVEPSSIRVAQAREFLKSEIEAGSIQILQQDIFDPSIAIEFTGKFDLIILKDVIEHINDKVGLLERLKTYLSPHGLIFVGFPPWRMPFGGHQQICRSKLLSILPWIHLLPANIYWAMLTIFGEDPAYLMDIKQTGISLNTFERIATKTGYKIHGKQYYLISPIYQYKFGLKPREQFELLSTVPWLRDFFTTSAYYLLKKA